MGNKKVLNHQQPITPKYLQEFHQNMKLMRQGLLTNEQKIDDIVKAYMNIYHTNLQKKDSEENILVNKLCRLYSDCTKNEPHCSEETLNHASSVLGVYAKQDVAKVVKRYKDYQKE